MTDAQAAEHALPARGQSAMRRFAIRLVAMLALTLGAWMIGALLAGSASAATPHAGHALASRSSTEGSADEPAAPSDGGLLAGALGDVTGTVRGAVGTTLQPVRQVIDPGRATGNGQPLITIPVVQEPQHASLLPAHVGDDPATDPSAGSPVKPVATRSSAQSAAPADLRPPAPDRHLVHAATVPGTQRVLPGVVPALADEHEASGQVGSDTARSRNTEPGKPQPVAPAPATPSSIFSSTHTNLGSEREIACMLQTLGGDQDEIGTAAADGHYAHRVPAARGLPAISPD